MSNNQWEVVGKNKKDKNAQNGKIKVGKDDKKSDLKVEDIQPTPVKSTNSNVDKNKKKDVEQKKHPKKQEKKLESTKTKLPKTFEKGLQSIDTNELSDFISNIKLRCPDAPLVWLKEIANFLNGKLCHPVDEPTFSNFPPTYPLINLPIEAKSILQKLIEDSGKSYAQLFFDISLTALANDMSKGQNANSYRVLLQLMAHEYPEFCVNSITKSSTLLNSYQNRPPVGLSLLWALGQGGYKDFSVGIQAWQELFLPLINLKNYSKYIVTYLSKLITWHSTMETNINLEQYLGLLDTISNTKTGLNKELTKALNDQLFRYKELFFNNSGNKLQVAFNQIMKKIPIEIVNGKLDSVQKVFVESLLICLEKDDSCHATWRQLFQRCSQQTAILLEFIDNNWNDVSPKLKLKSLKATLLELQSSIGEPVKGKKKEKPILKLNTLCQDILARMTSKSGRRFPYFWASFVLIIFTSAIIAYDVFRVKGNFPKSATGKFLNDLGVLEQTQSAWTKSLSASAKGYIWLENNVPVYTQIAWDHSKPYLELARDLSIVGAAKVGMLYGNAKEYVSSKSPVVLSTIEDYAPGLVDNVNEKAAAVWSTTKKYCAVYYEFTVHYLVTKVFIDEWSPEALQSKTHVAFNATRHHVVTYFHWLREQAVVYSEIP